MTSTTSSMRDAVRDAIAGWADRAAVIERVRAGETGSTGWQDQFPALAELGIFGAVVDEEVGGLGAEFGDLGAMLEQTGYQLVPGPVGTTAVAAAVAAAAGHPLAQSLIDGELGAAAVLTPITAGQPVVGLEPGVALLAPVDDADGTRRWCLLGPDEITVDDQPEAFDFSRAVGRVDADTVAALAAQGVDAGAGWVEALLVFAVAAESAGIARWTLDTAVDYAKVREQFGKPIGSFQSVKRICSEMLCRSEQISAAAGDVATALDEWEPTAGADEQLALTAATAAATVASMTADNAKDCIQVLGGIGFTFEHDAHLYLRRAVANSVVLGGASSWYRKLLQLNQSHVRRQVAIDVAAAEGRREEIRNAVAGVAAQDVAGQRRALNESGLLMPHWPTPFGIDADPALQLVIDQEMRAAKVRRPDIQIAGWALPTIMEHGTDAQRDKFITPTLNGEFTWCQLFSEPGAGSDLASLRTKAERVEGGWKLTGQKVWTSKARESDWAICLARTDASVPKHKGITYFLVDMNTDGIDIRPLREMTGREMFNEVFLDGVFVPDGMVVGEVNNGWRLARTTLANERVAMGGAGLGKEMEALLRELEESGRELTDEQSDALGELVCQAQLGFTLDVLAVQRAVAGHDPGAASSVRKLIGVRHRQAVAQFHHRVLGDEALVWGPAAETFLLNRCLSIAGGTTQILETAAAERLLGLPR